MAIIIVKHIQYKNMLTLWKAANTYHNKFSFKKFCIIPLPLVISQQKKWRGRLKDEQLQNVLVISPLMYMLMYKFINVFDGKSTKGDEKYWSIWV